MNYEFIETESYFIAIELDEEKEIIEKIKSELLYIQLLANEINNIKIYELSKAISNITEIVSHLSILFSLFGKFIRSPKVNKIIANGYSLLFSFHNFVESIKQLLELI